MPSNYSPTAQRFAEITLPSGGDPRTAASVGLPLSQIFDTLAHVSSERIISPAAIGSNQDNYNPTNWSDATYVRMASSGAVVINGANASVLQKHKIVHNIGNNAISLGHLEAGQTSGNQFACLGAVDHVLPPGEAAEIVVDPVSNVWRVIGVSRAAAYAWTGTHTWGSELSVAAGLTSVTTPSLNHATNEWSYATPRARVLTVPFSFTEDDAGDSDISWMTSATGNAVALNAGKSVVSLRLDSGSVLTGVSAWAKADSGTVTLYARKEVLNILTGAVTVSAIGTNDVTSGTALELLSLGSLSVTINNINERYVIGLIASAAGAVQSCGGIFVTYDDSGPRNI